METKICKTCGEEKEDIHFSHPECKRPYKYGECNVCNHNRKKVNKNKWLEEYKEKRYLIRLQKIKNREIIKCKRCNRYIAKQYFNTNDETCDRCIKFIKNVKAQEEEAIKEAELKKIRFEAKAKEKKMTAEEKRKRNNEMVANFLKEKANQE